MKHWKHVSMACMTVLAAAAGVGAADYETPKNRSVKDVLPAAVAAGAGYAVADRVASAIVRDAQHELCHRLEALRRVATGTGERLRLDAAQGSQSVGVLVLVAHCSLTTRRHARRRASSR